MQAAWEGNQGSSRKAVNPADTAGKRCARVETIRFNPKAQHDAGMRCKRRLANTPVESWRGWLESNQRPLASEANTLSTELQPRGLGTSEERQGYRVSVGQSMKRQPAQGQMVALRL